MTSNPVFEPVRALAQRIRNREISPVELTQLFLDRLESLGPRYNAVVTVARASAMREARQAEKEILSGEYRGPLHGIPYGAKDLLATGGNIPTTWGAEPFRHRRLDQEATVIRKLRDAGAVLGAKLAMVEIAGGMGYRQPNASLTGPGINPWDLNTWSGGSSSGSGSAVSAGLVPFAVGSETWGSILSPANNCGVTGMRPTFGLVSRFGAMVLSWTLDKLGPIGLSADDCGLVLEGMAGADARDRWSLGRAFRYTAGRRRRRFRLGIVPASLDSVAEPIRKNLEAALRDLEPVAAIEEVNLPDLPYEEITRTIFFAESVSAFEGLIESGGIAELTAPEDRYTPYARSAILAKDYIRALRLRGIVAREIDGVLAGLDALVGPSRVTPATPIDEEFPSAIRGAKDLLGAIGNAAGLPAISVPNGFTDDHLPTGMQLMGRAYGDNTVLAVARTYQSITQWHLAHPPDVAR